MGGLVQTTNTALSILSGLNPEAQSQKGGVMGAVGDAASFANLLASFSPQAAPIAAGFTALTKLAGAVQTQLAQAEAGAQQPAVAQAQPEAAIPGVKPATPSAQPAKATPEAAASEQAEAETPNAPPTEQTPVEIALLLATQAVPAAALPAVGVATQGAPTTQTVQPAGDDAQQGAAQPTPTIGKGRAAGKQAATPDFSPDGKAQQQATGATPSPAAGKTSAAAVHAASIDPTATPSASTPHATPSMFAEAPRTAFDAHATATRATQHPTAPQALALAQQIVRRFDGKSTSFDLRMDPPELGRIDVRLEVGGDQRVTAMVSADNQQTLNDLMRNSRDLERALQDAGLDLSENGLSFDLAERQQNADESDDIDGGLHGLTGDGEDAQTSAPARPLGMERWGGAHVDVWV